VVKKGDDEVEKGKKIEKVKQDDDEVEKDDDDEVEKGGKIVKAEKIVKVEKVQIKSPSRLVYETPEADGKLATFHHGDHAQRFGIKCSDCHRNDRCENCHDRNRPPRPSDERIRSSLPEDQAHKKCSSCHDVEDNCGVCHSDQALKPFEHSKTGLLLSKDHEDATCKDCHAGNFKKAPRCGECHDKEISFPDKLPGKRTSSAKTEANTKE